MAEQDTRRSALEALLREARRDGPPAMDWKEAEERLLARAGREPAPRPQAPSTQAPRWLLVAAAVAVTTVMVIIIGTGRSAPEGASGPGDGSDQDRAHAEARGLSVGARVIAGARSRTVTHEGHVTWTLEPGSETRVEAVGEVIALDLERGAIGARVTRSPRSESFVVRVGGTRVAVRGTVFRVARVGESVEVEVSEGIVAVGPVGGTPFELRAPGKALVTLAGSRIDGYTSGSGREDRGQAPPAREREKAPSAASAEVTTKVGPAAATVEDVIAAVRSCVDGNTVARGDLSVSLRTRLSLRVDAGGGLTSAEFAPPLAPRVHRCVDATVARMHFGRTQNGFEVVRTVELAH